MTTVFMPRLSESMEEGTVLQWLKNDGDNVAQGEHLVEVETDKATVDVEAESDGRLHVIVREGETCTVGAVIAYLVGPGEEVPRLTGSRSVDGEVSDAASEPGRSADVPAPSSSSIHGTVKASAVARRMAGKLDVDLTRLIGTGPGGRIITADVETAAAQAVDLSEADRALGQARPAADSEPPTTQVRLVEPSRVQARIARRMAEAKATIPEFTVTVEINAEPVFALRRELKSVFNPPPSVNDFVIKACGIALRSHHRVNGSFRDGHYELHEHVNVGMAVAAEGSLVVPVVSDADILSLVATAQTTRALAERVRNGTVTPSELAGGTFTVSNLGMFGVARFTAVINPPQAAILAVGAAARRVVPGVDGSTEVRRIMELTLTADHRIIYGADAAAFLVDIQRLLEMPLKLLVEESTP